MTRLTLVAPSDLSVGTLSMTMRGDRRQHILVTPIHRELVAPRISPGVHTAVIEPLGLRPRAFLFNVVEGQDNRVELPPLSFLASGPQQLGDDLLAALWHNSSSAQVPPGTSADAPGSLKEAGSAPARVSVTPSEAPLGELALSVGFSEDHSPSHRGGWRPYRHAGEIEVESVDGRLELLIPRSRELPGPQSGGRLRVEVLLEGSRVERAMVPLFAGGTRVILQGSALSAQDLGMVIVPVDALRRALTQALRAGVEEEARALVGEYATLITGQSNITADVDPWTDILAALLAVRFPEAFPQDKYGLRDEIVERFPWIADVHILRARDTLIAAAGSDAAREQAAQQAVEHFRQARRAGAPYFSYSNQLAMELLGALSEVEFPQETNNMVQWMRTRWASDEPRQRKAGTSFSWVTTPHRVERPRKLTEAELSGKTAIREIAESQTDAPATRATFNKRFVASVFTGQLAAGLITPASPMPKNARVMTSMSKFEIPAVRNRPRKVGSKTASSPGQANQRSRQAKRSDPTSRPRSRSSMDPPGLGRRISDPDDLHRRRFGERDLVDGFKLEASFDWSEGDRWVKITMQVTAIGGQPPSFDRVVDFFLHDTFQPNRIRAVFRGDRASVSVHSWGGFTVGAWLPKEQIELELNLAEAPGAPPPVQFD